jgi:hypothetical protein
MTRIKTSEPTMETIKEPMHPRRLEKNANTTLKSALLPQAVFMVKESGPLQHLDPICFVSLIIDWRAAIKSASGGPRFETIVACTLGFCPIRQSSVVPIVCFFNQSSVLRTRRTLNQINFKRKDP